MCYSEDRDQLSVARKINWCKPHGLQFNSFYESSPLMAFCCRSSRPTPSSFKSDWLWKVVRLSLLSFLSVRQHLSDADESSDSTDPWSNATRRCSSRQLKQKLFPSFIIWTFPMIYTKVNFYRHGAQSGIQGIFFWLQVPAISNPCDLLGMRHRYGGDLLKEMQGREELYIYLL